MAAPMAAAPQMGMPMGAPMGGMMPAPQMAMQPSSGSSPIGYIAVVCVVITLALSTWGVLGGNWVVPDDDDEMGDDVEYQYKLRELIFVSSMEDFIGDDEFTCEEYFDFLASEADISKSDFEDQIGGEVACDGDDIKIIMNFSDACEASDDEEEICETASAGLTGTIILWVAIGVGLIATLLIVFNVFNIGSLPINTQKFGMIAGISSGVLVAAAVVVWMIMIPDLDDGKYGLNVWLTFAAAATGIVGGILVKTHGNPSA